MESQLGRGRYQWLLLISVFIVATCGLVYELVAGTLASYLLGDSVTQFSTIIGTYLFAMGVGSYLSRFFTRDLLSWFIRIELLVGMLGGFSAAILFVVFEHVVYFRVLLYTMVMLTGIMVGLELPLLMRILKDRIEFSDLVSRIFTFDYIGALFASLLFPLLFIPHLGLLRTSFFFGLLNAAIAFVVAVWFKGEIRNFKLFRIAWICCMILLVTGFAMSDRLTSFTESSTYPDQIVYTKTTPYQRIVLTKGAGSWRLFLNGNLQFSSADEYRYHESLVHPGLTYIDKPENVLVLGGGDGMAVRELLKHSSINRITLVDLDKGVTDLFCAHDALVELNERALLSPKVRIINDDAFVWARSQTQNEQYDYIVIDFPDPSNYSLGKLYTTTFYREIWNLLSPNGAIVVQSTSPFVAKRSFWIIDETLRHTGFETAPYHCYVPSFGEWGFNLAFKSKPVRKSGLPDSLKFLSEDVMRQMFIFPPDMAYSPKDVNTLNNQVLVNTFTEEWGKYTR